MTSSDASFVRGHRVWNRKALRIRVDTAAKCAFLALSVLAIAPMPAHAQQEIYAPAPAPSPFGYAMIASFADRARTIAVVDIRSTVEVDAARAIGLIPGTRRFYVTADVVSLLRGDGSLARRVSFLIDLAEPDARRRAKGLKRQKMVLFGAAVPGSAQFQLLDSSAMLRWSPGFDAQLRSIIAELLAPDSPPAIDRIVEAFHVRGTVAGESETQIFLATATGDPVSLSIVRRPGMEPHFGAALGEIIDEAANVPPPNTLLWFRLACGLPVSLPDAALASLPTGDGLAARADYQAFLGALAPCTSLGNQQPRR